MSVLPASSPVIPQSKKTFAVHTFPSQERQSALHPAYKSGEFYKYSHIIQVPPVFPALSFVLLLSEAFRGPLSHQTPRSPLQTLVNMVLPIPSFDAVSRISLDLMPLFWAHSSL